MTKTREQTLDGRKARSDETLREASEHLYHEVAMLKFCGDMLVQDRPQHGWLYPAVMESFLVHTRNLNDFFFGIDMAVASKGGKGIRADDMIAEDFLGGIWQQKPSGDRLTKRQLEWVNKQSAHLSYDRHRGGRYAASFYENIMERLLRVVDQFLDTVPPTRLDPHLLAGRPWHRWMAEARADG